MTKAKLMLAVGLILSVLGGSGCAVNKGYYYPIELPLPARPDLPIIPSSELQCLDNKTYEALVTRQRELRQYAEELELIIKSTHHDGIR